MLTARRSTSNTNQFTQTGKENQQKEIAKPSSPISGRFRCQCKLLILYKLHLKDPNQTIYLGRRKCWHQIQ